MTNWKNLLLLTLTLILLGMIVMQAEASPLNDLQYNRRTNEWSYWPPYRVCRLQTGINPHNREDAQKLLDASCLSVKYLRMPMRGMEGDYYYCILSFCNEQLED